MNHAMRRVAVGLLPTLLLLPMSACQVSDVLIIGHRGSPWEAIENSIESFQAAYMQGADGVEFDVQFTSDGRVIVMHDETLDRTTTCSGAVRGFTLADLAGCQLTNSEPVQLVADVLPSLATWFSIVFLEIKVPETKPLSDAEKMTYTDEVVREVRSSGLAHKIVIISYDKTVLEYLATLQDPEIKVGWDSFGDSSVGRARKWEMPWSLMPVAEVSASNGAIAKGLGQSLAVYQVNSPQQFIKAQDAQVTAIMVDSIPTLCALLGRDLRKQPKKKVP